MAPSHLGPLCRAAVYLVRGRRSVQTVAVEGGKKKKKEMTETDAVQTTAAHKTVSVLGRVYEADWMTNISPAISARMARDLLQEPRSPLALLWQRIQQHFGRAHPRHFRPHHHRDPVVTVSQNFDELLFPPAHAGRSAHDSYYINRQLMLRTHMTAHEREMMAAGHRSFLLAGSVFRRDEIDRTHLPVFHQLEGVRIFTSRELRARDAPAEPVPPDLEAALGRQLLQREHEHDPHVVRLVLADLYHTLQGLLWALFGPGARVRWQETHFPFTQPSLEAEVFYGGRWLEVLGCGVLQQQVLHPRVLAEDADAIGWAFGLGLERIAMVLHAIPDIRLFWSTDDRFSAQFSPPVGDTAAPVLFVPFSKYPPIVRDISFYTARHPHHEDYAPSEFFEIVRTVVADLVESVELIDEYHDPQQGRTSLCYRLVYRAMDQTLTDQQVNALQAELRARLAHHLPQITLR